jgi:serine/threonine protein kinase
MLLLSSSSLSLSSSQCANILVDDRGTVKLADFGASKKMSAMGGSKDRVRRGDRAATAACRRGRFAAFAATEVSRACLCFCRYLLTALPLIVAQSMRGTPYYMAPEVIQQTGFGQKADIWSVGCTVLHMLTGSPPWKSLKFETASALLLHVVQCGTPPPMPATLSTAVRSFLLQCFERDATRRPTAVELMAHPFLGAVK